MASTSKIKIIKFFGFLSYVAFLAAVLLTATSYKENSPITDLSTLQLALCSVVSVLIPFAILRHRGTVEPREYMIWVCLSVGCAILAIDDKFMLHEHLDKSIHAVFKWEETRLSDKIDDVIVGIYGVIGVVFIFLNQRYFWFSQRFMFYAKCSIVLAFVMVLCDMKSLYGLSASQNQLLAHLEEWTKLFGGGSLLIGLLCAFEDALRIQNRPADDLS